MSPRPEEIVVAKDVLTPNANKLAHPPKGEEVVISGCSGSFPDSDGMHMFRDKLMNKVDLVSGDGRRWVSDHPEIPQRTGKVYNLEKFDAGFFGVHSKQANVMDPMMRVAFERVYEAIVDAGVNPASLRGTNTAVFNGTCFSESEKTWFYDHVENDGLAVTNCSRGAMANRISYWLGLNSLSCVTDTACSSTLYALEKAYFSMRLGQCDAAIVLGATVCLHPFVSLQFARLGVLSNDGKCKCFDENADGYCRSEAIPAVFLQKAKDAKRIYARVVHAKVNCDGFKEHGITFPSRKMQLQLLKEFYQECAIDPATVSFVEAHGTGTKVGDPEECNTLDEVFCKGREGPLLIGSVKSNMGHSEPSSGLSSVAKAIITLETGIIPPNLHYYSAREGIPGLSDGRLKVVTDPTPLPGNKGLIGVNSFGFGGANAHVLLEWNHKSKIQGGAPLDNIPRLVTVSGRHEHAVKVIFDDVKSRPLDAEFVHLLNELHSERLLGHNARGIAIFTTSGEKLRVIENCQTREMKPITFLLPGLGGQFVGMGKSLMKLPPFAASIEVLSQALSFTDIDLYSILTDDDAPLDNILNSILATVACQIGLVDSLASVGACPEKILGYSIGEIAAAYAVRNLTADQAIKVAYFVGKSMLEAQVSNTSTIQVDLGKHEIVKYQSSGVQISAINSQKQTSLVGPINTIRRLREVFQSKGVHVEDVNLSGAGLHSHYVSEIESKLTAYLKKVIPLPMPRSEKWISTGDGKDKLCSAEYFVRYFLNPVELDKALDKLPLEGIILDIGPKNGLKQQLVGLASQYIETFDSQSVDRTIPFLAALGKLYLSEVNLTLSTLYPAVEYPVSRGTPMIAPLVRWDHSRDWFVNKFAETDSKSAGESKVTVSLKNDEDAYIAGHMIDGRVLYPATGYVSLIAKVMRDMAGDISHEHMVVLEDINFLRATPLTDTNHEFTVSVEKTTGNFEILEGGALVVTGRASFLDDKKNEQHWADPSVLRHRVTNDAKKIILSKKDIYKELRLRGYNYTGLFRGLDAVESTGSNGLVAWNENWVAFMDTMLQIQILNTSTRDLHVPTYIGKIIMDPKTHFHAVKNCQDAENPKLPINFYRDVEVIKAGGVEIWNLRAQQIARRKPMEDAVLEKYTFTPHNMVYGQDGLLEATRILIHLALENLPGVKVKVLELADEALSHESALMAPCVASVLSDLPLIQADVRVVAPPESYHGKAAHDLVTVDDKALQTEKDCSIVIGADLLTRVQILQQIQASIKESGFIITREKASDVAITPEFTVLAEYTVGEEKIKLLRKNKPPPKDVKVVSITSDDKFSWIAPLKEALLSNVQQVIALAQNDETSGILGLVNCLLREPSGEKLRCVYIRDQSAPRFDIQLPLYAEQLKKNLIFNVYENGVWGSYRHQALSNQVAAPSQHVYINNRVKGDLSSFTLFQGPYDKSFEKLLKKSHVKIYYAALNFKDVMLASGKMVLPSNLYRSNELNIGIEFSGINEKGERVMGIMACGALVTITDEIVPGTTWKVPDGMSLEDAATMPIVYLTVYRAIVVAGKAKRGESILIHAGAGGVGISAINISLSLGLQVFTTVGSAEKRKFLHDNYPQIPDSHIGNSRDISFEDMIKKETNNRGVDLVLNSLADEKMQASLRCLTYKGRFLEIGKYDLLNNVTLAVEPFMKNITYTAVMLDLAMSEPHLQKHLRDDMADLMRLNLMKPLPRTTFDFTQPEQAIRYMTTGKHIGKVLLKVRDESESPDIPKTYDAVPRYFCNPDASYIILGGLGGFGLELSNWLVSRGARALVVTSRTGVQNGYQGHRILAWESVGARVEVATDDVSTEEGVEKLLNKANALAPVAGIFNLAVVLKDSVFENQTEQTFRESFAGKAKATAILDKLSRRLCPNLQDFVVFSSVSCGRGNPGQSNYGMSNSVMERICEKRKSEGLPGLAVEWGAIGEVGLVAEMAETNQTLVIGGTLQQTISSCLQCMDAFLTQDAPVVASMVVAEKRSGRKAGATMVETVGSILGIRDLKTLSHNTSLSELGMDSMTAVEIKQTLEREFEVFLSAQDLRGMTFAKLAALDSNAASGPAVSQGVGLNVLVQELPPQAEALEKAVKLNNIVSKSAPVFFVPGFDGLTSTFVPAAKTLDKAAVALIYPHKCEENTSIAKTAQLMLPALVASLPHDEDFKIVGYSAGALVAIELASLLEAAGRKGLIVLVDGSPALMSGLLKTLQIGETQDEIENSLLAALQDSLLPGEDKAKYLEFKTWDEKVFYLDSLVANNTEHSKEYLKDCARDLLGRLKNLMTYKTSLEKPLKSKISLIKPQEPTYSGLSSEDFELSAWTVHPVEVFLTKGNHITMWSDSQLATLLSQIL